MSYARPLPFDHLSPLGKSFVAGSLSAACSTLLLQPFDLVKTKIQSAPPGEPRRMWKTARDVVRAEGAVGLWRGLTPTLARTVPGVGIYLASLVQLKALFFGRDATPRPLDNLALGGLARTAPALLLIPVTVVKARFESGTYPYANLLHALGKIYASEGFRGLTRGLAPTLLRDAPFSGIYYMLLVELKSVPPAPGLGPAANTFAAGVLAGCLASAILHPADVVKTKMQVEPERHATLRQAVRAVATTRGPRGFYLGLAPRLVRRTLFATFTWTVFEGLLSKIGLP